jgi:hypothetical protein
LAQHFTTKNLGPSGLSEPPEAKRKKHPTEKMTLPTEKAAVSANSNLGTPITGFIINYTGTNKTYA